MSPQPLSQGARGACGTVGRPATTPVARRHGRKTGRNTAGPQTSLVLDSGNGYTSDMSTLAEIEAAVDALPAAEKQQLLLFIAARLRSQGGSLPAPREFTREQVDAWIAEDEADMKGFSDSQPK